MITLEEECFVCEAEDEGDLSHRPDANAVDF